LQVGKPRSSLEVTSAWTSLSASGNERKGLILEKFLKWKNADFEMLFICVFSDK